MEYGAYRERIRRFSQRLGVRHGTRDQHMYWVPSWVDITGRVGTKMVCTFLIPNESSITHQIVIWSTLATLINELYDIVLTPCVIILFIFMPYNDNFSSSPLRYSQHSTQVKSTTGFNPITKQMRIRILVWNYYHHVTNWLCKSECVIATYQLLLSYVRALARIENRYALLFSSIHFSQMDANVT